jgi:DNA repair photolyase
VDINCTLVHWLPIRHSALVPDDRSSAYRIEPCRSAINAVRGMMFDWSLNPYMGCAHRCTFCYVRAFEKRADRPSDDRYGRSIRVKSNIADVLRFELSRPSWKREFVAVGAATDPYQPAEGMFRLTRACIRAFAEARSPFGIVTRGPLAVRDIDVLQDASRRAKVGVYFSVPTLDERVWRTTEPGTPPPRQRLRALRRLVDAGIKAGVAMAPIIPGLSDRPEQMAEVVKAARDAGAVDLWPSMLYLRDGTRQHFMDCLARDWPQALPQAERIFAAGAHMKKRDAAVTLDSVRALKRAHDLRDRRTAPLVPPPEPQQLDLAI